MSDNNEDVLVQVYLCPLCGHVTTGKDTPEWYWHKEAHIRAIQRLENVNIDDVRFPPYYPVEGKVKLADIPRLTKAMYEVQP